MNDGKPAGVRCLATREIRAHTGLIKRFTKGVMLYHLDNLGRRLIYVQWDNGLAGYVYPMEIEALASDEKQVPRAS